ncbi:MAG TPA: HAD hydrolase-like protein [Pseudonocardiaceae bacterium]|nr:HAD hydrolase-like protein [Pseudonocardiaceae bacterium]
MRTDIWMVGDDPVRDAQGATRAGLSTVWVSHQRPWPDDLPLPTVIVAAPADALRYLQDLVQAD